MDAYEREGADLVNASLRDAEGFLELDPAEEEANR